jgi:hypothetical protein
MGLLEDALAYRQKLMDKADEQSAEINAKYFPKMGDVVGMSSDMGGGMFSRLAPIKSPAFTAISKMVSNLDNNQSVRNVAGDLVSVPRPTNLRLPTTRVPDRVLYRHEPTSKIDILEALRFSPRGIGSLKGEE